MATARTDLVVPTTVRPVARPNIAFCGKAGAGKTTCAEIMEQELGYHRLSFASTLKDCTALIWGERNRLSREKNQKLGVAVRGIDEDAWVNCLIDKTQNDYPASATFVNDDLRFPNEWLALKTAGWVIVRVTADRPMRVLRLRANGKLQDESQLDHISETAIDDLVPDYTLPNSTDIFDLRDDLAAVLDKEARKA